MTIQRKHLLLAMALAAPLLAGALLLAVSKGYSYALTAHDKGQYSIAFPIVFGNALLNDRAACALLGSMYLFGQGVEKDGSRAEFWLTKAANKDVAEAQTLLGVMYATGQGVPRDVDKGRSWLARAASRGNLEAARILKQLYAADAM